MLVLSEEALGIAQDIVDGPHEHSLAQQAKGHGAEGDGGNDAELAEGGPRSIQKATGRGRRARRVLFIQHKDGAVGQHEAKGDDLRGEAAQCPGRSAQSST